MAAACIEIPEEVLDSARMTPVQLKQELALALYAQGRLSAGKARELAGLALWEFRQLAAARRVPVQYDAEELAEDLATIGALEREQP